MTLWTGLAALFLASLAAAGGKTEAPAKLPAVSAGVGAVPVVDLKVSNIQAGPGLALPQLPSALTAAPLAVTPETMPPAAQPQAASQDVSPEQASHAYAQKFDGAAKAAQAEGLDVPASQLAQGGSLVEPSRVLDGKAAVAGLAADGRNWYYKSIKGDQAALRALAGRLDSSRLPAKALERRLLVDAALTGVELKKVVGVYRYGSSVWGHKSQPPSDMDVLVVVEGEAKKPSVQTREAMSVVSPADPKSFALYLNEEAASQPGRLPLNVTVVSREYIRDFIAEGKAPEELSSMGVGDLTGDWGHGVLVYGEDALSAVKPTASQLVAGARETVRNAGGFMENYVYKSDGRKAQSISKPTSGGMAQDELEKLPPKVYLRHLEAQLRLRAAMEAQGRDEAAISTVLGTDPREAFRRYLMGEDFPDLPGGDVEAVSRRAIELHNRSEGMFTRLRRADQSPAQIRRERLKLALVGLGIAAMIAALLPMAAAGWSAWTGAGVVLAAALLAASALIPRAPPAPVRASELPRAADIQAAPEALADAWQDGSLDALGASPRQKALLDEAARKAVREVLAAAKFKVFYRYGIIGPTMMYEAPELPGVLVKTYGSPFYFKWLGGAWKGYNLAKRRLGGYFAETSIVEDVEIFVDGKRRRIPWGLVQEKLKMEGLADYRSREIDVLNGMYARGVVDNDNRPRGFEVIEATRNLGETAGGKLVHLDADFFAEHKDAVEGPKRVRDPPVIRDAIRAAQLAALAADSGS